MLLVRQGHHPTSRLRSHFTPEQYHTTTAQPVHTHCPVASSLGCCKLRVWRTTLTTYLLQVPQSRTQGRRRFALWIHRAQTPHASMVQ